MNILGPWLAATIEGELSEALKHWEETANGRSPGLSYDDGSNLRIPSAKKAPVVQITKFLTFEDPIQVTLSDSVVRVNASVTNQASQRYYEKNRRKFTEGTLGGLMQLHKFEIVATHLGPRDKRLTLYVKEFKCLGSNGSGTFGVAPQAIESREGTKELLNKLADLRRHGLDAYTKQSAAASPIRSQPSTQTTEAGNHQDSQVDFATQVAHSIVPAGSKSKSLGTATSINISSTPSADRTKPLARPEKVEHGNPLASTLSPLEVQATPQRPAVSHREALLGLLRKHKRASLAPELDPKPAPEQLPGQVTASSLAVAGEGGNEASRTSNLAPSDANADRAPTGTQKRKRQSPQTTPRKKASNDHDLQRIDSDRESLKVNHDLENRASSGVAATKASIDTVQSQPTSPSISESKKLHPYARLEPPIQSVSNITSSASAQNTIRNRISSRDINIPKDQDTMLSRADSWLPAEPGQREPSANIPISLLKRLNEKADLRAQEPIKSRKQGNGTVTPSAVIDSTADSESDAPVSSGQWPASPEREQLPPDSSLESAEHSDHSVSYARRQRKASFSFHSIPPRPPSPVLARPFSRDSGPFGMTSPSALSPSGTSTRAGEEVHCSACQVPGCNKLCKRSGGLKDHVDRCSPSTESLEYFKCLPGDCTKSYASPGSPRSHIERHHDGNSVLPSHSGSATPTAPGVSTLMSLGMKSWSGRDGGSGQKSPNVETNNILNSVEVLASMPLLLDGRTRSSRDEEVSSRRSSTKSELGSNMPPDAPPDPIQPANTDPGRTFIAKENPSSLVPASPTPESELEFTVPLALNEKANSILSAASIQSFPSTASQPQDPFTQVKRTPYINGRVQNGLLQGSKNVSLLLKSNLYPPANGNTNDFTELVSASIASGPETSTAETHGESRSSHTTEDQKLEQVAARLAEEVDSQEVANSNEEKPDELRAEYQQGTSKAGTVADRPDDSSLVATESPCQSSRLNQPVMVDKASVKSSAVSEKLSTPGGNHKNCPPQLSRSDHVAQVAHGLKRKAADLSVVSPSVAKRQKRFKVPSAFTFTERSDVPRDPSEGARQYRQDFLASRRSSESSTATMSPTMPFTVVPTATPEKLRDPLERARQIRQEFLASRRSSESSTPTTSPRVQYTALTGLTQAECRNAEVERNLEQVTFRNQSIDTRVEHQKMAELKELSTNPQKQGLKIDGAPLPNGAASIEPDRNDAKPGAQDSSPSKHEVELPMFVAQNADVNGPDAEQSTVMEACIYASNDGIPRPRSVEFDGSVRSPDHQEAEDRLANAKDEADPIINLGMDVNIASHNQPAERIEESRPAGQESDKARKDLPTKADEVAKQESNVSTPREKLDHFAEFVDATPESIHRRSIEENLDTQMPDQIVSESAHQERSVAVDANTPVPDKVAMEPTSDQQLIGVDTNNPMADLQVFQDMSVKPIAESGVPTNQIIPLSSVVSASIAESNTEKQRHLSPTSLSLDIALNNSISDSTARAAEKQQNPMHLSTEITEQGPHFVSQGIFDKFKATYPSYPGDMKHFAAICRKISQLVQANRMEHQSLWDDFIVRHKIEYPQYLRRCAEEAEDAVSYEIFYQTQIEGPQYQKRIINRRNLDEVLALASQQANFEHVHAKFIRGDKPRLKPIGQKPPSKSSPVSEKIHHESAASKDDESLGLGKLASPSTHKPAVSYKTDPMSSASRVVIDLTGEDPPDSPPTRAKEIDTAPRWSFPHLANGWSVEPPPLRYREDSSGSLYQVPSTPPFIQDSHVSPSLQPMRSPLVPAAASTKSTTKIYRRILPWTGSDNDILQSSTKATVSDFSRGSSSSRLREIRAKGSNDAGDARLQVSTSCTPDGPKQSQALLNNCHRIIQSNWGIKAHELLEPEYCHGQVWSETMIELLAEIANKVTISEARKRIKGAIDARMRENAWGGPGHASQDRTILKSDLEVVRGIGETSSMSTTSPISPPHTNAAVEKQNEGTPSQWWDDDNTPFKSFARAYASIRPGNGNSFAKADPVWRGESENVHGARSNGVQFKKINIMGWQL